jgi:D-3-phosphoglycerate dehydrogenase
VTAPRILVLDELDPVALDVFRERNLPCEVQTGLSEDELCAAVPGVEALVVRSATKITRPVIEAATALRVVGRAGVGVDNVDRHAATERGVVVMNTPTGNTTSAGEHAFALMMAIARNVPRADRRVKSGAWNKKGLMGSELAGKTLGVVGLGRIGRVVAERGRGFAMDVIAHDPFLGAGQGPGGIQLLELDDLLDRADFVTLHVPLTDDTRGLLSAERIARMKPGAYLVNAARGGLVDEAAVAAALDESRLAGAAFDVLSEEPPTAEHPLLGRDDVVVTPHLGASSREAQRKVALDVAEQIADFLETDVARNAVNAPAVAPEAMAELAPYLVLAEKLGALSAQRAAGPVKKLELTIAGAISRHDPEPLRLALLVGALRAAQPEGVNFVNAPLLARERGLKVLVAAQEEALFAAGELEVSATPETGAVHDCAGTVLARAPRIVRIDGARVDLRPEGPLLVTRHRDAPGVLGAIAGVLGERGVNIRRVEVGPAMGEDGLALGFLALEGRVDDAVGAAVAALEAIEDARLLRL